jgi:23S rRNA (guanine745-N1)-methyltransferase
VSLAVARDLLACPVCREDLTLDDHRLACSGGHSFDVARSGYVNLANAPEPASADTPDMLRARMRVLAGDLFAPLTGALAGLTATRSVILDVGAGTGHHLAGCLRAGGVGLAVDVSRSAARLAARAHPRIASVAADVWRGLPVRSGVIDAVLCVFAPRNLAEFRRVLRPDGRLIVVTPGERHLAGLRDAFGLLGIEPGKRQRLFAAATGLLSPAESLTVAHRRDCSAAEVSDLVAMGPNAFHGRLAEPVPMRLDFEFRLDVFTPLA